VNGHRVNPTSTRRRAGATTLAGASLAAVSAILDAESAHVARQQGLNDRIDQIRQRVAAEADGLPANQQQPGGQQA